MSWTASETWPQNIIQSYTHRCTCVWGLIRLSWPAGSPSVLTSSSPGLTTDRQAHGGRRRLALPSVMADNPPGSWGVRKSCVASLETKPTWILDTSFWQSDLC